MMSQIERVPAAADAVRVAPAAPLADPVLEIKRLCVDYGFGDDAVHAVAGCDLKLRRGEVVGLAGERGSGKSTLAMAALRLLRAPAVTTAGQVLFHSKPTAGGGATQTVDMLAAGDHELRSVRWSEIAVVLQTALNALNPVATIGAQFDDVLHAHRPGLSRSERRDRAGDLLGMVGTNPDRLRSYAHELSGGMRQVAGLIGWRFSPMPIWADGTLARSTLSASPCASRR
jgi:peptide/nickel transport system ATP-binding protein